MAVQLIPLTALKAQLQPDDLEFLGDVIARDQNLDGTDKGILRRMLASDQCRQCHEDYKKKHKNRPFKIKCFGIYDTDDYVAIQAKLQAEGDDMALDEIREIYDAAFWADRTLVVKDEEGNIVPLVMRAYQRESMRCTSPRKVDRWGRGLGKRLNIATPIPTPSGWTTMGDLRVGDLVFNEAGEHVPVTYTSPILLAEDTYEVEFSDGSVIHADAEHLWETWTHGARKAESRKGRRTGKLTKVRPTPQPAVRTTEEIRQTLLHGNGKRIERNHSVVLCEPLQYAEANQPIHPYLLGYWLGDGSSGCSQITTADTEVLEFIRTLGYQVEHRDRYTWMVSIAGARRAETLHCLLKQLGVLKDYSNGAAAVPKHSKFIPENYLRASVAQREALLKGLMDSDGTCSLAGTCSFSSTNERLARGVFELVVGLGFKPTIAQKTKRSQHGTVVDVWEVGFTPHRTVFGLARKANRQRPVRATQFHRYIIDVRPAKPALMRCIEVDSPRHLYLAGWTCIPTHNTMMGVAEELHFICTNKNTDVMVVCPAQSQAQLWWDEIMFQIQNAPRFKDDPEFLQQSKQQPYLYMRFGNGALLKIFTAGSKAGRGADAVRSQSPRRIRLEEQDFLADKDYQAIMPLLRRFKRTTFHGSSTPTGLRGMYWQMCMKFPEYKEFYHPVSHHPAWGTEQLNEEVCFAEAKTMDRYRHEWLAEFGDPLAGVFKSKFVDEAIKPYGHKGLVYSPMKRYFMGIDWNGKGTGTRICVVEYDPETRIRKVVARATVDDPAATTKMSIAKIVELNRWWHCEEIYVDAGFGFVQDELLKDVGHRNQNDPDTAKLKHIKVIDFGAKLKTNKIVPFRDPNSKYLPDPKEEELERRTKPFLVEGAVMCFEGDLIQISGVDDKLLEEQLRGYRVKTWTKGGQADTYETDAESGDHDLDALFLALLGIELKYGLWHSVESVRRLVQIAHVSGWGLPATGLNTGQMASASRREADAGTARETARDDAGIPARTPAERTGRNLQEQYRLLHLSRSAAVMAPTGGTALRGGGRVPSRTGVFQQAARRPGSPTGNGRRFRQ